MEIRVPIRTEIVGLGDLNTKERHRVYRACYSRAVGYAFIQALVVLPAYFGLIAWVASDESESSGWKGLVAFVAGALFSVGCGYTLVVAFVRTAVTEHVGFLVTGERLPRSEELGHAATIEANLAQRRGGNA